MSRILARLAGALLMFVGAAWADPPQFLIPHGPPAHAPAHGFRSLGHPVRVNAATLAHMRASEEAQVRLPNATQHTYVLKLVQSHGDGIQSFVGYIKDRGNLYHAIVTTGPTGSFGVFSTPDGEFRLVPGDGHDWLIDMTAEQEHLPIQSLGNDAKESPATQKEFVARYAADPIAPLPGMNLAFIEKATPTPQYGIDIMFVVTQGLANRLGGGLMTRLHNLVVSANTAYAASEVALTMRIVGVEVVNYTDTNDNDIALGNISPSDAGFNAAVFGNIETRRTAVGADFVALMRDGSSFGGSGIAWIGGITGSFPNATVTNPQYMYSVTTGCVVGCETVFIHEVGHNMGNRHDRATAAWQANNTQQGAGNQYGYYFCTSGALSCNPHVPVAAGGCEAGDQPECSTTGAGTNNFSEIMAYFQGSTTKNLKFSNPNVTCAGAIGALPCGDAVQADTAASMNERRQAYSAIRGTVQTPPLATPGSVQFTAGTFFATETAGNVSVTVSRVGGSSGGIIVQYATTNGTATAGLDYTTTAGQLQWNDGETANKTILIPVLNDSLAEGGEAFTVTLSGVAGLAGAFLGKPDVATVIINEPWPAGGTPPAGFTNPSGPAWAIANDTSADGDSVSWKSGALTFSGSVPAASVTQYTATFSAGTVAFAYRVNSYPGFGFFEFLIDGVVVASNSGDSGWLSFSTPITAGTHTLQWRYRPTFNFFCGSPGVDPAPPQGTACADRAWIDALSLPPIATGPFALTVNQAGDGTGTVTSLPVGINCPGDCTETYAVATPVTLTATPTAGSVFTGWSGGGCSGTVPCAVTMFAATTVTATFSSAANAPRVTGISTRARVQTGDNVMIGGFIIQGSGPKTVVVRARGPSTGVAGNLADPTLMVVPAAGGPNLVNDDWGTAANAAQLQASGFAPGNPKESAVLATLNPGAYTAIVSGVGNTTGVAIVEVYEIDGPQVPITGISTRASVLTGDNVMIGGFIIQGSGPTTVVIRARGPSTGVAGALADPVMTVVPAAGGPNLVNDDWGSDVNAAALLASGFAPSNQFESAILVTLNPGAYTAIVSGFQNTTGVAIIEVYKQ